MSGKLKGMLNKLVFDNQSAFDPNRGLHDSVLVLNQVVDFTRRNKKCLFLTKVVF